MADFSAPSWLFPKEGAWESFVKGTQAGAAVAANNIRAKQVYADIAQTQQRLDLASREQVTRDEASNLHNEVIRTKLNNDAADFQTLREWWPKFQSDTTGEIDPPVLRDENNMLKVTAAVAQRRDKIGQAKFAQFMSSGVDLATPDGQQSYYNFLSDNPNIIGKLGPDGIMAPVKVAENLKRLRDEANSRIAGREDRSALDALIEQRRALLSDSTVALNDARIQKLNQDIGFAERELAVKENNVKLRDRDVTNKENRFNQDKWQPEDREEYRQRSRAIQEDAGLTQTEKDQALQETRAHIDLNRQQREGFKKAKAQREGLKTSTPEPAAATPIAPSGRVSVVSPDGKVGTIPESQLDEALKSGYKRQ